MYYLVIQIIATNNNTYIFFIINIEFNNYVKMYFKVNIIYLYIFIKSWCTQESGVTGPISLY